jgi:hypothetical protein
VNEAYVLLRNRKYERCKAFLEHFVPARQELAEDYPVPEFAEEPVKLCRGEDEILRFLAGTRDSYSIYWSNAVDDAKVKQAMVFFLSDGSMILGLAIHGESEQLAREMLRELVEFSMASLGYVAFDERPPDTSLAFMQRAQMT